MLYYFINWETRNPGLNKTKIEFLELLKNNKNFNFLENLSDKQIEIFIKKHNNVKRKIIFPLLFCHTSEQIKAYTKKMLKMLKIIQINNLDNTYNEIYFFTTDPWINNNNETYLDLLYNNKHINVISSILDLDDFKTHKKDKHTPKIKNKKKLLCFSSHYSYEKSIININNSPINKIALSGNIKKSGYPGRNAFHKIMHHYPQKYKRLEIIESEYINPDNKFSKRISKYLCNYYDGVFKYNKSIPLLKIFEILASGSLLVYNINQQPLFNKLGLIDGVNCIALITHDKEFLQKQINYLLNHKNRTLIDYIRSVGQQYAIKNFSAEKKYEQFLEVIVNDKKSVKNAVIPNALNEHSSLSLKSFLSCLLLEKKLPLSVISNNTNIHVDITIPFYLYNMCPYRIHIQKIIFNHYENIIDMCLKKYNAKLTITFIGSEKELSKDFIKNNFNKEYTYYEFDQENCSPGYNSKFLHMLTNKFRFCYQKSIEKKPNISLLAGSNDFISMNFFEQVINYYDPNKKQLFGIDNYFNGNNCTALDLYNGSKCLDDLFWMSGSQQAYNRDIFQYIGGIIGFNDNIFKTYYNLLLEKFISFDEGLIEWFILQLPDDIDKFNSKDVFFINMKTKSKSEITPHNVLIESTHKNDVLEFKSFSNELKNRFNNEYKSLIYKYNE